MDLKEMSMVNEYIPSITDALRYARQALSLVPWQIDPRITTALDVVEDYNQTNNKGHYENIHD